MRKTTCPLPGIAPSKAKRALGLLREVQRLILEDPKRVDMRIILSKKPTYLPSEQEYPPCGAVGCIAGWVTVLKGLSEGDNLMGDAGTLLGLTAQQQKTLFVPLGLIDGDQAVQTLAYARRVSQHIDRFIKRNVKTLRYKKV